MCNVQCAASNPEAPTSFAFHNRVQELAPGVRVALGRLSELLLTRARARAPQGAGRLGSSGSVGSQGRRGGGGGVGSRGTGGGVAGGITRGSTTVTRDGTSNAERGRRVAGG